MKRRKSRSYGYIGEEKEPKPQPQNKQHVQRAHHPQSQPSAAKRPGRQDHRAWWQTLLLFLVMLPYKIVVLCLQALRWIWDRRPEQVSTFGKTLLRGGKKTILYGIGAGILAVLLLFAWAGRDLPNPDELLSRQVHQSTKIYDRTGEHLLYEIFAEEKRTLVELEDLPEDLVNGVIATEDSAFYEHRGIRPLSIMRSIVYGLLGKGRIGGGASTLTQQLVKNAILSPERTLTRKAKEFILSIRLEQRYTKDQILKIYFNEIPYGSTNYGAQSAAQAYFGKDVQDLALHESAVLAGLPKAPTYYLNNSDALKTRRNFVLRRMEEEGFITEEEKLAAQALPLEMKQSFSNIDAPHFVLYVKEQLVQEYGEQKVETGGLKVITTLDWEKQQAAERVIAEAASTTLAAAGANNAALVAMDPTNAHVLSLVGSRDFFEKSIDGQFNVATHGRRQPGSSFKPIIYAAAFEKGYTPETVVFDVLTNFAASGRSYEPRNYDLQERGPVSLRQALQGSLNIPAVKALYLVGEKFGVEFAQRLGYSTINDPERFGLSLVLGGGEVTLLEHVRAYTIFANEGTKFPITSILKVEEPNGDVLYEWKSERGERVLDKGIANLMSNVLSDDAARAYAFGAGGVLTLPGRPVAAKTGTTNSYVDAWTVGYTPQIVTGIWAGNTNNTPMTRGYGGSRVAAPIWNAFMREATGDMPVVGFPAPPKNTAEKAALRGGAGGSITLLVDKVTGKLATSSTPKRYIVERTYTQPHSILHYVKRDDPRGEAPENPADDPQYAIWEAAIQSWIERRKEEDPDWEISFEEPPTEYDDIHDIEMLPSLEVVFPAPSSTITSRQLDTDIRVSAPRGVTQVTYRLNGRYVGVVREHPFNLNKSLPEMRQGENELTIYVEDDVGNRLEETVLFFLDADAQQPGVTWGSQTLTLSENDFPYTFILTPIRAEQIASIKIFTKEEGEEDRRTLVEEIADLNTPNGQLQVTLERLEPGEWSLETTVKTEDNDAINGGVLQLRVE